MLRLFNGNWNKCESYLFIFKRTRAAVAVSSHVPVAVVFLSAGCVTISTTVGTTATRKDVVRKLVLRSNVLNWKFSINIKSCRAGIQHSTMIKTQLK